MEVHTEGVRKELKDDGSIMKWHNQRHQRGAAIFVSVFVVPAAYARTHDLPLLAHTIAFEL